MSDNERIAEVRHRLAEGLRPILRKWGTYGEIAPGVYDWVVIPVDTLSDERVIEIAKAIAYQEDE